MSEPACAREPRLDHPDHTPGTPAWDTPHGTITVERVPGAEVALFSGDYLLSSAEARQLGTILIEAARIADEQQAT